MTAKIVELNRAVAKFKTAELELGRLVLPALGKMEEMNKIAEKVGVKTSTLTDLALVAAGLRRRHRAPRGPQTQT